MNRLRGVIAPVVTTFSRENGELDLQSFAANIRAHINAGLHGILVNGSTGEAALLDAAERGAVVDAARAEVPPQSILLVGTGSESTRTCIQQTRDAAKRGADAVLVVAPHYYGPAMTAQALREHYQRVADASPVPVLLYNIPKYMHFSLAPALVSELGAHGNIVGIKDSSGNQELLSAYMNVQSPTFTVLTGNAQIFQDALAQGARGGILAVSLFAPAVSLAVFDGAGRATTSSASAHALHSKLGAKIVAELGVAGVKAAMDHVGLAGGPVRSPLLPLETAQRDTVNELLRSAELATAA